MPIFGMPTLYDGAVMPTCNKLSKIPLTERQVVFDRIIERLERCGETKVVKTLKQHAVNHLGLRVDGNL